MTITEIAKQLNELTIAHYINGEKFTYKRLETYIRKMLATSDSFILEICMGDGRWLTKIRRYGNKADQYDYFIPDTREQEEKLKKELYER